MNDLSASRLAAFVAVIVAVLMVGPPAGVFGNMDLDPVGTASAADGTRIFKIGVVDMTISTLNPNIYTMVAEGMAIFPLYSNLMQWDQSGEHIVGDIAKDWWVSPDGLTYEFELVDNAYFVEYNAGTGVLTKGPQVTSADVKWSIDTLAADDRSRLNSYWPDFDGVNIIERTWCDSPMHFGITIREPFVPFQESLMGNPIFPKYIWENVDFATYSNIPPVGSGAFYYKTNGLPDAGFVQLARNPYWHGDTSYGWQLHVDEFVMVRYDDVNTLYEALDDGDVDSMMGVDPATFVFDLPTKTHLQGYSQSNGFVYEFNLNQMTDALRKELGGVWNSGSNDQILLNHSVKKAISMAIDRNTLIADHLYGYGTYTTTLVPSQNPMSHNYGEDGHDCLLDPGASPPAMPDPVDRVAARNLLWDAGWRWDAAGTYYEKTSPGFSSVYPLYNASASNPDRKALSFDLYTLNTGTTWESMCMDIVDWCKQIGVEFVLQIKSVNQMNSLWYSGNYDAWLWDWVLYPYGEAVSSVLSLFITDVIGTDSDVYISDPVYDAMYDEAIREMDYDKRKELCYDMQDWVYLNRGCNALAFREDMYAFNTLKWENFGDLENEYFLLPDIWPNWLCAQMNPVGNVAPLIGGIGITNNTMSGVAEVGTAVTFRALGVSDDHQAKESLEYKWIWGFGGEQQVTSDVVSHTFTEDGVYSITLVVRETAPADGHADYFSSFETCYLTVHDMSNNAPHSPDIIWDIPTPTAGEVVTFTGSAVDDEEDDLYFTWDFGDGSSSMNGQVVEHQFPSDGSFTVTMYVDDHRYGQPGTRPVPWQELVAVGPNHPPSISVPDYGSITVKTTQTFSVQASDRDPRDNIKYSWDWGDGSWNVTDVPYADHYYGYKGTYTIEVWADDQTGLSGHNVSDKGTVMVVVSGNDIPAVVLFEVSKNFAFLGEWLTFTGMAGDGDGDALTFTFDFDDGTEIVRSFGSTGPNLPVECIVDKAYSSAGTYSVYLTVSDGSAFAVSPEIVITIGENVAPVITSFEPEPYYDTGVPMGFSVSADDDDGDDMRFSWDWGDGTTSVTLISVATHTFAESGTYTVGVTVDDFKGFYDYAEADVTVNWAPYISPQLSAKSVDEDVARDYSASAYDADGDSLTYMWDFGDGKGLQFGSTVSHTYDDPGTYVYRVYVWDGFVLHRPTTHNVTSSSTVEVGSSSVDDPPVVDPIPDIYAVEGEEVEIWVYADDDGGADCLTYTWDFGDSTPQLVDADPPVNHVWVSDGEYTLKVWVSDASGIPENTVLVEADVYIENDDPPIADAGGDRTVPEDVSVTFTGIASYDDLLIESYHWTVNDHDGPHEFNTMTFPYTFEMPGTYYVELVVEDCIGQLSDPDEITVTVTDETAPFNVDAGADQPVANNTLVTFSGSGEDEYDTELEFTWTFIYDRQLKVLEGQEATWTFSILGGYVVTLRVEDDAGNYAEDVMTVTVEDRVDPVADAGPDQPDVMVGDTVTFDGSGSYDDDSSITYTWTFTYDGKEQTLYDEAPTFVFDIAGEYIVTLTVEDEGGNTASDTMTVTVSGAANDPPVADAGDDQPDVLVGDTVTFDGSGSSDDVEVTNYTWTFTYDGETVTLYDVDPTFVFDIAGEYVVTLTVSDEEGLTDTDTVTITVSEAPPAENVAPVANAGSDRTIEVGETVTFSGSASTDSDGTIENYTWTFTYDGQARTLYGVAPSWTFEVVGVYTVTLTVTDDDGDTGTDTVVITVEEPPAGDDKSFIEKYGLVIAAIVIVLVVVVVAMLLMKKKKSA